MMLMLLFAVLMLFASYSMIKEAKALETEVSGKQKFSYPLILLEGGIVGMLTGLVGAGGGFLIIPALVVLSKRSEERSVGKECVSTFSSRWTTYHEKTQR